MNTDRTVPSERLARTDDARQPIPGSLGHIPFRVEARDVDYSDELTSLAAAIEAFDPNDEALLGAYTQLVEGLVSREIDERQIGHVLITLASGIRYVVDTRDRFAAMLSFGFLPEASDFNLFCRLVEPGATIVDVGANFGLYAIEAARIAGPDATVVAFEPVAAQFALLQDNIVRNGVGITVDASDCAVADTAGERTFHVTESASFSGLIDTGRSAVIDAPRVSCIALDRWPALEGRPAHLLKIDVEGAELGVLRGAMELMERSPDLIVQFEASPKNHTRESQGSLLHWLSALVGQGYVIRSGCSVREPGGAIEPAELIRECRGGNSFLMRRGAAAEERFLSCVADEHSASRERAAQAPSGGEMVARLIPMFHQEFRRNAGLEAQPASVFDAAWWRLGKRFVSRILRAFTGRRPIRSSGSSASR